MMVALTKRHRLALSRLRSECDYEDGLKGGTANFILDIQLAPGIGAKTLSELKAWGLIIEGPHRWSDATGYRITGAGRAALE
jgi:hypothetical protein